MYQQAAAATPMAMAKAAAVRSASRERSGSLRIM
jgi:hypothetical protein